MCLHVYNAQASENQQIIKPAFRSTKLPLPRFATLKSGEIYARAGPGKQYPVRYEYTQKHLPVEIILEYGPWRKIRDPGGDTGWIHSALLSGNRYALIKNQNGISLKAKPRANSQTIAQITKHTIIEIDKCKNQWCKIEINGAKGWVEQKNLFGVYPDEIF